jgi:hypothetical protein
MALLWLCSYNQQLHNYLTLLCCKQINNKVHCFVNAIVNGSVNVTMNVCQSQPSEALFAILLSVISLVTVGLEANSGNANNNG